MRMLSGSHRLLVAKLTRSAGPGIKLLAVKIKDIEAKTGTLTLFDAHQAGFKATHQSRASHPHAGVRRRQPASEAGNSLERSS